MEEDSKADISESQLPFVDLDVSYVDELNSSFCYISQKECPKTHSPVHEMSPGQRDFLCKDVPLNELHGVQFYDVCQDKSYTPLGCNLEKMDDKSPMSSQVPSTDPCEIPTVALTVEVPSTSHQLSHTEVGVQLKQNLQTDENLEGDTEENGESGSHISDVDEVVQHKPTPSPTKRDNKKAHKKFLKELDDTLEELNTSFDYIRESAKKALSPTLYNKVPGIRKVEIPRGLQRILNNDLPLSELRGSDFSDDVCSFTPRWALEKMDDKSPMSSQVPSPYPSDPSEIPTVALNVEVPSTSHHQNGQYPCALDSNQSSSTQSSTNMTNGSKELLHSMDVSLNLNKRTTKDCILQKCDNNNNNRKPLSPSSTNILMRKMPTCSRKRSSPTASQNSPGSVSLRSQIKKKEKTRVQLYQALLQGKADTNLKKSWNNLKKGTRVIAPEKEKQSSKSGTAVLPTWQTMASENVLAGNIELIDQNSCKAKEAIPNFGDQPILSPNESTNSAPPAVRMSYVGNQRQVHNAASNNSSAKVVVVKSQHSSNQLLSSKQLIENEITQALSGKVLNQNPTSNQFSNKSDGFCPNAVVTQPVNPSSSNTVVKQPINNGHPSSSNTGTIFMMTKLDSGKILLSKAIDSRSLINQNTTVPADKGVEDTVHRAFNDAWHSQSKTSSSAAGTGSIRECSTSQDKTASKVAIPTTSDTIAGYSDNTTPARQTILSNKRKRLENVFEKTDAIQTKYRKIAPRMTESSANATSTPSGCNVPSDANRRPPKDAILLSPRLNQSAPSVPSTQTSSSNGANLKAQSEQVMKTSLGKPWQPSSSGNGSHQKQHVGSPVNDDQESSTSSDVPSVSMKWKSSNQETDTVAYWNEVKRVLGKNAYHKFQNLVDNYRKTRILSLLVNNLAELFLKDSSKYHLYRNFYKYILPYHKKEFDSICQRVTGQGCDFKPEHASPKWITKRCKNSPAAKTNVAAVTQMTAIKDPCKPTSPVSDSHLAKTSHLNQGNLSSSHGALGMQPNVQGKQADDNKDKHDDTMINDSVKNNKKIELGASDINVHQKDGKHHQGMSSRITTPKSSDAIHFAMDVGDSTIPIMIPRSQGDGDRVVSKRTSTPGSQTATPSQSASSILESMREELTCAICTDELEEPKDLNCSHSFCKICLQNWLKSKGGNPTSITCPVCQQDTALPNKSIDGLKTNNIIKNLAQHIRFARVQNDQSQWESLISKSHQDLEMEAFSEKLKETQKGLRNHLEALSDKLREKRDGLRINLLDLRQRRDNWKECVDRTMGEVSEYSAHLIDVIKTNTLAKNQEIQYQNKMQLKKYEDCEKQIHQIMMEITHEAVALKNMKYSVAADIVSCAANPEAYDTSHARQLCDQKVLSLPKSIKIRFVSSGIHLQKDPVGKITGKIMVD